jgi:hypothetical protein
VIASPGSVEAQRAFILGDPKPEADVGNLARPITDVVSSPHSKRAMTVSGHEDAFPRPRLRARCRLGEPTFAGMGGKEEDAPIPTVR